MEGAYQGDPFLAAFRSPDLLERLSEYPEIRQHLADPGFQKEITRLRDLACDPKLASQDASASAKVSQQVAKAGQHDPRIMQAIMALQGQRLLVGEKDLKRAEDQGDMQRREPVQLEQLLLVKGLEDPTAARLKGNEYFKSGDYNAALAHYQKGVELLRQLEEVKAADLATLLSNSAMCLLKLKWPDRAKDAVSQAIEAIRHAGDEAFDQSKLFHRRSMACEQLGEFDTAVEDMGRAIARGRRSGLAASELRRLEAEVVRLKKLKASHEARTERRQKEKDNERTAEVQRMQGAAVASKPAAAAASVAATGAPGGYSGSYLAEQDFSHLAWKKVAEALPGVAHLGQKGTKVEIVDLQESDSKVQACIATKRGKRALYYEMDLSVRWKGTCAAALKPKDGDGTLNGIMRVYNIAHDTKFELGGDENTSYMYQLGWDQRMSGSWIADITAEAAELFDLVAEKVDGVIKDLQKK
eukprot:TRINITY_DN47263_c0_g1_i1.p1 TRINITY_DN47263_c0_g1~~TRINITY_DN47263_c0_g1_i1.p1  ORF type:complete len:470 (-),score=133.81 TRINITY_DN47263_c0_g1_i1:93-1502(-)